MKKNEKRGIIISIIISIMGIIGIIYTTVVNITVEDSLYMYTVGTTLLVLGVLFMLYYIKLSKNKKRSNEQENIYMDERINKNKEKSFAITFKIIIGISLVMDFVTTFFLRQYKEYAIILGRFVSTSIILYLIVYAIVSKRN